MPARRVKSLLTTAQAGDRGETLRVLRDHLAHRLESAEDREAAALSRQLTDVLAQLAALPAATEGTPLDELARRRAAAGRPDPPSAGGTEAQL